MVYVLRMGLLGRTLGAVGEIGISCKLERSPEPARAKCGVTGRANAKHHEGELFAARGA